MPRSKRRPAAEIQQHADAVSVRAAAHAFDISYMTMRRWIHNGWIPAYRVGTLMLRVRRDHILQAKQAINAARADVQLCQYVDVAPGNIIKLIHYVD